MKALMNSVIEMTSAPTTASSCVRSASGEIRSFSRNWRRKCFVSSTYGVRSRAAFMLRTHRRDVGEIGGHFLGIVTNHQLREDPFERAARHQGAQPLD